MATRNLLTLEFQHWTALWHDLRQARSWQDRLILLLMPPGWSPAPAARAAADSD
jgi:hypothetical protein